MKIGDMYTESTTQAVRTLLDTFSGADGGASFVDFCSTVRQIDKQAIDGDKASEEIMYALRIVARLCRTH